MKKNSWKALIMAAYLILISGGCYAKSIDKKHESNTNIEQTVEIPKNQEEQNVIVPTEMPTAQPTPLETSAPNNEDNTLDLKSNEEIAYEVINGLWSDGDERKAKLTSAGYDYDAICDIVNRILTGETVEVKLNHTYSGKFAYTNQNTTIYDENGNYLCDVDTYQKAIVLDNNENMKHVIISGLGSVGEDKTVEGFINNDCLTELPDTFVEVDLSLQKVYLYDDGELVLEANVITGGPNKGSTPGTNVGCTEILLKNYNTELSGPTWSGAYVDIFIKFNWYGEGYHDADNWRSDDEYTLHRFEENGSHGCVNMKQEDVEVLDKVLKVGDISLIHN